ncbi:precorrin-6y C5,15-methyltransferase (decarboxylating) subunit CbiE [Streptomyces sp. N35]|uniref:precorrin-6y C5,15-methyltransferase (decarboxylating) subunit CbiE n=1 Tax=Streptomyces sp. N35 TaxID=2795730 RepID=UPI0018F3C026|nr:precorrin-6y C5,15-methyltransferase (decarboxylating) subunit CbiE [Streptomyces sp. N35]
MADRVTVIGWDGTPLTDAARSALGAATLVAGAAHHLALPEVPERAERIRLGSVSLAARRIARHRGTAVVLADGDPGFFGVVRTLRAPEFGLEVEVVPAVSSVAQAFARAGMPWDDAQVVVAHRRTLRRAVNVCRAHTKVAVLTSPGAGPAELGLLLGPVQRTFVICEELGTSREQVTVLTSDKAADRTWRDPNVVIVIGGPVTADTGWIAGRDTSGTARGWALPASAFGGGLGEAENDRVRAAQLARLGRRGGDPVGERGGAGGASRPGAARFGAAAIAVDRDADSCARTTAVARRFGVQLQVVHGTAPHVLEDLPEPDVVRVGGGGAAVVSAVADRRPERIVTHASTRDEAELIGRDLMEHGYAVECSLLQSVELDTRAWSELERVVAFVISAERSSRTGD